MYRPEHFREDRAQVLDAFITAHPLATLVASTPAGLVANHMPLLLARESPDRALLRGHIARGNDLWRVGADASPVLVIFAGPQHYVSPAWYPSKRAGGKVVPTWNYAVVHAHGSIRFIEDAQWLHALVAELTQRHEHGRNEPWSLADAPRDYIDMMLRAIVGFEIAVDRFEGKFKASQNRDAADRAGVDAGLAADGVDAADRDQLVRPS
jgi:transcriptional regulator